LENGNLAWFRPFKYLVDQVGDAVPEIRKIYPVGHQSSSFNELTIGVDRRQTTFLGEFDDQSSKRDVFRFVRHDEALGSLLRKGCKCPVVLLLVSWPLQRGTNDGNRVFWCHVAFFRTKSLPKISRLKDPQSGYLRHHLLQQLDALCPLVQPSNIDANPSDVAA